MPCSFFLQCSCGFQNTDMQPITISEHDDEVLLNFVHSKGMFSTMTHLMVNPTRPLDLSSNDGGPITGCWYCHVMRSEQMYLCHWNAHLSSLSALITMNGTAHQCHKCLDSSPRSKLQHCLAVPFRWVSSSMSMNCLQMTQGQEICWYWHTEAMLVTSPQGKSCLYSMLVYSLAVFNE
jgi:hypothetical protein